MSATTRDSNRALLEAGLALASELSLSAVLQRIVELAVEITGARYGALGVLGREGTTIAEFITSGVTEDQRAAIGHTPVGRGILGALIKEAHPLRLREISEDPRSVGFPPNHPPMHTFLGAPVKARGTVFGNIYLTEKQGGDDFSEEDEGALVVLAAQAGVAVENAHLYEESQRRQRWLEAVRDIATTILAGGDPEQALRVVAERARELMSADLAIITTTYRDAGEMIIRVADGDSALSLEGTVFPTSGSASGEAIRTGMPLILADASADERAYQPVVKLGRIGPSILVPLWDRDRAFGTLIVANTQGGRPFSDDDLALVESFAAQAAVAIEYGRVQGELRRLAVLEDRERIAKELHDGVIQSLFAVGMGLQATATVSRDPDLEHRIEEAVGEVDRVIRDLRNYIFGLRPGILADRQLDQAIRSMVEDFEAKTGVTAAVDVDAEVAAELSSRAVDLVQLVREALSNVGRHAGAATCRVSLHQVGRSAILEIDDDGLGYDPGSVRRGNGLRNLAERVGSLRGELSIESPVGEGTTVRISIPL